MKTVLLKPIITEKSMLRASSSVFTFLVDRSVSKNHVAEAVERAFAVHVTGVTTAIVKGGGRRLGRRRNYVQDQPRKIARVHLKSGEKIALFDAKKE